MKSYFFLFLSFTIIKSAIFEVNDPLKLVAVSGNPIAEGLYRKIRNLSKLEATSQEHHLGLDDKRRICHNIIRSEFFDFIDRKYVYEEEIYQELRTSYQKIFTLLYEKSQDTANNDRRDMIYTNPTKLIEVTLQTGEVTFEYAFLCLGRDLYRKVIEEYYVSREYNVSDSPNTYVAGRFVFQPTIKNVVRISALAEEAARALSSPGYEVEREYLRRRSRNELAESELDNPLCALDVQEMSRVCNIVSNSTYFNGEITIPYAETASCNKTTISFRDDETKSKVVGKDLEESMIRCTASQFVASYQFEYFLSHAYQPNQVFAYRWEYGRGSRIILENLFDNVRFKGEGTQNHSLKMVRKETVDMEVK